MEEVIEMVVENFLTVFVQMKVLVEVLMVVVVKKMREVVAVVTLVVKNCCCYLLVLVYLSIYLFSF